MAIYDHCHIVRFVLCEYQKINSSALPVIFISFKLVNEKINFRRQQRSRGTENRN